MKSISITYRFWAILVSFFILMSSVGVSANLHFCKERLTEVSFGEQDETDSCEQQGSKCCSPQEVFDGEFVIKKHSECCTTTTIATTSIQSALVGDSVKIEKAEQCISDVLFQEKEPHFTFFEVIYSKKEVSLLNYSPPLLIRDTIILVEQFLC